MKNLLFFFLAFLMLACDRSSCNKSQKETLTTPNGYDSLLALETGADVYGMRKYVMAFLKEGPNRAQDSVKAAEIQRAHLDNITRMAAAGQLILAGPFFDDFETKGLYIFAVESVEEAEELTKTDPAIQSGRLVMELHPWYGSAALMKVNELHTKISKEGI